MSSLDYDPRKGRVQTIGPEVRTSAALGCLMGPEREDGSDSWMKLGGGETMEEMMGLLCSGVLREDILLKAWSRHD